MQYVYDRKSSECSVSIIVGIEIFSSRGFVASVDRLIVRYLIVVLDHASI